MKARDIMKTKRIVGFGKYVIFILMLVAVLAAVPITSLAAQNDEAEGIIPQTINGEFISGLIPEEYSLEYPTIMPSRSMIMSVYDPKFDPRENGQIGNYVTPIKNQGPNGLCWSFAAYGAVEANMLHNGYGEQDLSELHMAYATSTSNNNSAQGFSGRSSPSSGGNRFIAATYLMRGTNLSGTVSEDQDPYGTYDKTKIPDIRSITTTQDKLKNFKVENVLFLSDTKTSTIQDTIKQSIRNYGAVGASMYWDGTPVAGGTSSTKYWNGATNSYYFNGSYTIKTSQGIVPGSNHGVLIVGWDDSYDKAKFVSINRPSNNGAWLVKNSWGESWGDNGYFWISYEDKNFPLDTYTIDGVKPYDLNKTVYELEYRWGGDYLNIYSNTAYVSRVFNVGTGKANEWLNEVVVALRGPNYKVSVDVIPDFTSFNSSYSFSAKGSFSTVYPGYYTIQLDEPVTLGNAGSKFAVVVKVEGTAGNIYYAVDGTQNAASNTAYYSTNQATIKSGTYNFVIKAITSPAESSVMLSSQASPVYEGGGTTTFPVSTTGIANGNYAVELGGAPEGVTASNISISGNKGTLTLNVDETADPGTYTFNATINGTTSNDVTLTISDRPTITITTQPQAMTIPEHNIVGSLSVAASVSSGAAPTYRWYSNDINNNTGGTAITGATNAAYTIPTSLVAGTYYFYCVVSAPNAEPVTSDVAAVTISEDHFITIVMQPPETVSFMKGRIDGFINVVANESYKYDLLYQWYENDKNSYEGGEEIFGKTTSTLMLPTSLDIGTYYYYCVIKGELVGEPAYTRITEVTINAYEPPVITINSGPQAVTEVTEGRINGSLSVNATASYGEAPTYQWYSNTIKSIIGGTPISGEIYSAMGIPEYLTPGDYYYYCIIDAPYAETVASSVATVTVSAYVPPTITITAQPQVLTNIDEGGYGGSLSVGATVSSGEMPSYQWYKNDTDSNYGGEMLVGETYAYFPIPTSLGLGTHYYYCVVSADGAEPVASYVAAVIVEENHFLTITSQPTRNTSATEGYISGSLYVAAAESYGETLTYQWYANGYDSNVGGAEIYGETGSAFAIPADLGPGTYYYYCVMIAEGAMPVATNVAIVTVIAQEYSYSATVVPAGVKFPDSRTGYSNSSMAQAVTITNTGGGKITALAASLLNDNPLMDGSSFEIVSALTSSEISPGGKAALTVRPKQGLAVGSYQDYLIVTGDEDVNEYVLLEFKVSEAPTIELTANRQYMAFLGSMEGYSNSGMAQFITISNTGTERITGLAVSLDSAYFEITGGTSSTYIDSGESMLIYARPVNGLKARSTPYTGTLTVSYENGNKLDISLSFAVSAASAAPANTLYINAGTGGWIVQGSSGQYAAGTTVSVRAEADNGYTFAGWTSSNGGQFANANSMSTTFTMPGNGATITANFTYTGVALYGDLNGNGIVDMTDMIMMLRYFAQPGVTVDMAAADVNGDGRVNNADLILFMKYFSRPNIALGPQS